MRNLVPIQHTQAVPRKGNWGKNPNMEKKRDTITSESFLPIWLFGAQRQTYSGKGQLIAGEHTQAMELSISLCHQDQESPEHLDGKPNWGGDQR